MGYLKGYECDLCRRRNEDEDEFIGLQIDSSKDAKQFVVDDADFHICLACARVIAEAVKGGAA